MITAGDERGRTQRGNNNAYCQDNEISWVDWRPDDAWLDLCEVTRTALRLRREHPALRQRHYFEGRPAVDGRPQGPGLDAPDGREMTDDDWFDDEPAHARACSCPATRSAPPARAASSSATRRSCSGSTPARARSRSCCPATPGPAPAGGARTDPATSRRRRPTPDATAPGGASLVLRCASLARVTCRRTA